MIILRRFQKVFDIISEVSAFITITLIAYLYLNQTLHLTKDIDTIIRLATIREYLIMLTIFSVGFKFAIKRNIIIFVIFVIIALIALSFSFASGAMPTFI